MGDHMQLYINIWYTMSIHVLSTCFPCVLIKWQFWFSFFTEWFLCLWHNLKPMDAYQRGHVIWRRATSYLWPSGVLALDVNIKSIENNKWMQTCATNKYNINLASSHTLTCRPIRARSFYLASLHGLWVYWH